MESQELRGSGHVPESGERITTPIEGGWTGATPHESEWWIRPERIEHLRASLMALVRIAVPTPLTVVKSRLHSKSPSKSRMGRTDGASFVSVRSRPC